VGHCHVRGQAVADDGRACGLDAEALHQGLGHVTARLAHDRLGARPGARLQRGQHRRAVGQPAVRRRAVRVRVRGNDRRAVLAHRPERRVQLRVDERAVERDDDDLGPLGIGRDLEALGAQARGHNLLRDQQQRALGVVRPQVAHERVDGGDDVALLGRDP
jgi:hypothetical protein